MTILIFWLFSCGEGNNTNDNLEKSEVFFKYYSDQCPEWEIMNWWDEYLDWRIKVNNCIKPFTCPEWKKVVWHYSPLIEYDACKLSCLGEYDNVPEWF